MKPRAIELCAGAGGQALGLEMAGFDHVALFENDKHACATLKANRPHWNVINHDLFEDHNWTSYHHVDLVAGGLPCPPFSVAGKQLGEKDDRNLFNVGISIVEKVRPKAVMFENVKGMLDPRFADYRAMVEGRLRKLGYEHMGWRLLKASDFGVPQLRPRVVMVAIATSWSAKFLWPEKEMHVEPPSVGQALEGMMAANGWRGAKKWAKHAAVIAPTLVGGSKKHGGPDLGPTRSRKAWETLGVDGRGLANEAPSKGFIGLPRLTVSMAARIQGFPNDWVFVGGKTASYRQVGNAFPPQVAHSVAKAILAALTQEKSVRQAKVG